jgi:hypothetical protein
MLFSVTLYFMGGDVVVVLPLTYSVQGIFQKHPLLVNERNLTLVLLHHPHNSRLLPLMFYHHQTIICPEPNVTSYNGISAWVMLDCNGYNGSSAITFYQIMFLVPLQPLVCVRLVNWESKLRNLRELTNTPLGPIKMGISRKRV